jgi:hypothetical protein
MRGCLFTILLGIVVIAIVVVVGLPAVAAGVLTGGIRAAGLQSDDLTVKVSSDPPTDLVGMHADRVHVVASDATFRGMDIGQLDLTLEDVADLDRTAGAIDGTLGDVGLRLATGEDVTLSRITISGNSDGITATTVIPAAQARALIMDAVERETGVRPADVTLSSPDLVGIRTSVGLELEGRLDVTPNGDLVLTGEGPLAGRAAVLVQGGQDLPIELTDVRVNANGGLRLTGDLALSILG